VLPLKRPDQRRWITPEPLNVAPQLIGLALATPPRRAVAMAVDMALVGLLSGVSGFWLLGGLVAVVLQLRSQRGTATRKRVVVGWLVAGLIGLLALQEAGEQWDQRARRAAVSADADEAVPAATPAASGVLAVAALAAVSAPPTLSDAERIEQLEEQLAQARKPKSSTQRWRDQLSGWVDEIGLGLGWGIVYFSLLPALWGGQTVGKKLLRLRVVELTGKPLTVMRCLKRYGGYAAGLATGGIGFAQLLWDPNRQALHDKAAHTAVIDLRAPPVAPVSDRN
jgi:hypothetical protein